MGEVKELELYQPDIMKHPGLMKGHISFLGEVTFKVTCATAPKAGTK